MAKSVDELHSVQDIVKALLLERPKLRDSDELLACLVYEKLGYSWNKPFFAIMQAVSEGELPTFESITRCRRKMQEKYPQLRGKKYQVKQENQEVYKEYVKE